MMFKICHAWCPNVGTSKTQSNYFCARSPDTGIAHQMKQQIPAFQVCEQLQHNITTLVPLLDLKFLTEFAATTA